MSHPQRPAEVAAWVPPRAPAKSRQVARWMLTACGVWLMALGLYFMFMRPPLLPEDPRFMGTTLEQIRISVPGLEGWLRKVLTVLGGFMAGAGVLTVFVATVAVPLRSRGTPWVLAISGALTVVLMSATNFALHSDFKWLLLLPALVWLAGLVIFVSNRETSSVGRDRDIGGVN